MADDNGGKPIFKKWSPYDSAGALPVEPSVRLHSPGAVQVPLAPENAPAASPRRVLPDLTAALTEDELLHAIEGQV